MVPYVKFVFFSGPRRRGSSTSVNSLRIPRAPVQGQGLLSPPCRDQPMMQRWETDFVQHCTYSTQFILCNTAHTAHSSFCATLHIQHTVHFMSKHIEN